MARLHFVIAFAAFVAVTLANSESASAKREPVAIESVTFHYVLGARINDRQIGITEYKSGKGTVAQDYQSRINHPPAGAEPSNITYVDLTIECSAISNVYVTAGSIGENHISILVEANNTTYLNTKATFYGV